MLTVGPMFSALVTISPAPSCAASTPSLFPCKSTVPKMLFAPGCEIEPKLLSASGAPSVKRSLGEKKLG